MPETNAQHRIEIFQVTRAAVLNGELSAAVAVTRLTGAGWSIQEAGLAVSVWGTLAILRPVQAGYQVES